MSRPLPQTFHELVEEVLRFTGLSRETVEERIWQESLQPGWNVGKELATYRVTPHHYNNEMEQLYSDGTGFIFETLVAWARPQRREWASAAEDRLRIYGRRQGLEPAKLKILMLGDGTGSDSLFLAALGFVVDYYDFPGGRTWDFAMRRFEHYGVLGKQVRPVESYENCLSGHYDAILSFEVLEHVPKPLDAIRDVCRMLKPGGIALVTESFGAVIPEVPTHLLSNKRYAGRTPFLFLKEGLHLSWYSRRPTFKPMEYSKLGKAKIKDYICLIRDGGISHAWLAHRAREFKQIVSRHVPLFPVAPVERPHERG